MGPASSLSEAIDRLTDGTHRYEVGGRGPNYDCMGFCLECWKAMGINVVDLKDEGWKISEFAKQFRQVRSSEPGDLLYYRRGHSLSASHVAIVENDNWAAEATHMVTGGMLCRRPLKEALVQARIYRCLDA